MISALKRKITMLGAVNPNAVEEYNYEKKHCEEMITQRDDLQKAIEDLDRVLQDIRGEMEQSALKEISNIITGAYLNALSTMTGLRIEPSVPDLSIDMAGAILSVPAIEFGILGDEMLLIQSQIYDEIAIDGFFIMVPDVDSYKKILTSLGLPV